jgi:uracil-DNA glycosylase family 4
MDMKGKDPRCLCSKCGLKDRPHVGFTYNPEAYAGIMLVGEAPGLEEVRRHEPFVGKSGRENDSYLVRNNMHRSWCYITNLVKCNPAENRDPTGKEVRSCSGCLVREVIDMRPKVIGALGRFSSSFFRGEDMSIEASRGRPFLYTAKEGDDSHTCLVIPMLHPAYGIHRTEEMPKVLQDYSVLYEAFKGRTGPAGEDKRKRKYKLVKSHVELDELLHTHHDQISIDTEWARGGMWCLSFSKRYGEGYVVLRGNERLIKMVADYVDNKKVLTIMHNSKYDLRVLKSAGVVPARYTDTMVMAYLLQTEPQGLKALGYRHLGIRMRDYEEVVEKANRKKALRYVLDVSKGEWGDPPPVLGFKDGKPHVRQPWNPGKKAKKIINDVMKKGADPYQRWMKIKKADDVSAVEEEMGVLTMADLSEVPIETAVNYAAQDADVTMGIYPLLMQRVRDKGLEEALKLDCSIIPMISDMENIGMKVDIEAINELRQEFKSRLMGLERKISGMAGRGVNPGSTFDTSKMLAELKVYSRAGISTDAEHLKKVEDRHPVVPLIIKWRGYDKLVSSYINVLPARADKEGRVHTTIKSTRTRTGRLASSNPNLMAQPVRTEEGRMIRGALVAAEGHLLDCADYSQIEMRIAAHESGDTTLCSIFRNKEDIHKKTAAGMFKIKESEVDEMKHRYPAKRVGFGILTGITPEGLANEFALEGVSGWTVSDCSSLIKEWYRVYSGVHEWIKDSIAETRRTGVVRSWSGRVREVPEIRSNNTLIREAGERYVVNGKVQMGAQDVIKKAMRDMTPIYKDMQGNGYFVWPLIQVHDELLFEVDEEIGEMFLATMISVMEGAVSMDVPIVAEGNTGKTWKEAK